MEYCFHNWHKKPLVDISKDMVAKRHAKIGEESGGAYANLAMRVLRAVFNFAIAQYEDSQGHKIVAENPVNRLSQTRAWYRVDRRQTLIKLHELPAFIEGVMDRYLGICARGYYQKETPSGSNSLHNSTDFELNPI